MDGDGWKMRWNEVTEDKWLNAGGRRKVGSKVKSRGVGGEGRWG